MRMKTTLLAACAAALLVPAAAQAATLSMEGDTLVYRGEGSEGLSLLLTSYEDWDTGQKYLSFQDSGADRIAVGTGVCGPHPFGGAAICDLDPNRPIRVEGSAARDSLSIFSAADVPDSIPVTFNGNDGDDSIKDAYDSGAGRTFAGGPGKDELFGYAGNDHLDGGDGDDVVDGGEHHDRVLGGAGNDEMHGDRYEDPGADLIDGGPGNDVVAEWDIPELLDRQPAVNVTLDGVANDGRPGEGDNVVNAEQLDMYVVGSITGSDAPEKITVVNPANTGPSTLVGRGGDDELVANDFNDTVDGGPGNDLVEGGLGNDTVTGGPGQDTIYGDATASHCNWYSCKVPFGNDVIEARDGEVDNIDCGLGQDRAIVDAADVLANCETVDAAGGGGGGGNGGGKLSISVRRAKLGSIAAKGLKVKVPCAAACTVSGSLTADKATARKLRTRKVGSGRAKATSAGTATVTLKVAKKVKRPLRALKSAKVTVKITVTTAGGDAQSVTRKLTFKR